MKARHRDTTGPETVVPYLLAEYGSSFPAWEGKIDDREKVLYVKMCRSEGRE